jgi:hypothetical protein
MTMKFSLENCDPSDWDCKCQGSTNIVKYGPPTYASPQAEKLTIYSSCYNNCPDDSDRLAAEQIREQNCIAAKAYGTQTTTAGTATPSAFASVSTPASTLVSSTAMAEATGSRSGIESNNVDGKATKSLTGLEATATPNEGAASARVKAVGSWLAFLGLGLGVLI